MSSEEDLKPIEEEALELLRDKGKLYQSELWKELDIDSRKASRLLSNLEDDELVIREEATHEGHRTYLVRPTRRDRDYTLLLAGNMLSPFVGSDEMDPIESDAFTQWILELSADLHEEIAET